MSRKLTQAEEEERAWQADRETAELAQRQSECPHWYCHPSEWNFQTGTVRKMVCDECGKENYLE